MIVALIAALLAMLAPAERINNAYQTQPEPPPPTTTTTLPPGPPTPIPGDCDSWAAVFAHFGADGATLDFFFGRTGGTNIIWRETRCGTDTLNESSGDSGICQINPVHNRAGYFGRRYFGAGGWLGNLHGLRTRQDTYAVGWADACLTLFQVCGTRPWQPPYGCANNRLENP